MKLSPRMTRLILSASQRYEIERRRRKGERKEGHARKELRADQLDDADRRGQKELFRSHAALLGKADICLEDTMTGAYVTTRYYADTNFDKKYNSKDHLAGKGLNLYCLTSDASFSCGNLVPSVLKQSSNASIIGQTSGGGACVVLPLCTASGTFFKTSGSMRISFVKNGSFYDVDEGAAVDYALSKKESFYDREKLVEYIDSLL